MEFNWRVDYSDIQKWDLKWSDTAITGEFLNKMAPHQKINHFPGMSTLSRKNTLAKNLKKMQELFQSEYNFFPKTFLLPQDYQKLKHYANEAKRKGVLKTYIVKPEANSQGRGIFLTQNLYCIFYAYIDRNITL